jgi:hypothetical protein
VESLSLPLSLTHVFICVRCLFSSSWTHFFTDHIICYRVSGVDKAIHIGKHKMMRFTKIMGFELNLLETFGASYISPSELNHRAWFSLVRGHKRFYSQIWILKRMKLVLFSDHN